MDISAPFGLCSETMTLMCDLWIQTERRGRRGGGHAVDRIIAVRKGVAPQLPDSSSEETRA
jgi:hypothetical protein